MSLPIIGDIKDSISTLFQIMFKREMRRKMDNITENEVEKSNNQIKSSENKSEELDSHAEDIIDNGNKEELKADNEIEKLQNEISDLQSERDRLRKSSRRKKKILSRTGKLAEVQNKISDNQNELINKELGDIDDRIKLGLELIEYQIGEDKVPKKFSDRLKAIKGSVNFVAQKVADIQSDKELRDKEQIELNKEKESEIDEEEKEKSDELEVKKSRKERLSEWWQNQKDNSFVRTRKALGLISSSKNFLNNQINLEKQRVKKFSDAMYSGLDFIIDLPVALREMALFGQMLENFVTDSVLDTKVGQTVSDVAKWGIDKLFRNEPEFEKAKESDLKAASTLGVTNLFSSIEHLDEEKNDDEKTRAAKGYVRSRLKKQLSESGTGLLGTDAGLKRFQQGIADFTDLTKNFGLTSIKSLIPFGDKDIKRMSESLTVLWSAGVMTEDEYKEFNKLIQNPQTNRERLTELRNTIAERVNELGTKLVSDRNLVRSKPGVNFMGITMGPLTAEHINTAYDLAGEIAVASGLDYTFDPMITSGTDNAPGRKGTTHASGRALDLRLGDGKQTSMSKDEAIARSTILGQALQVVLKNAGILDKYRIVSHQVTGGAPHFHLEYLGDKDKDQTGDFVQTTVGLDDKTKKSGKLYTSQAGQLRISYPKDEKTDPIIIIDSDGNVSRKYPNGKIIKSQGEELPKVPSNSEKGEPDDTKEIFGDKEVVSALLYGMNSMKSDLAQLILASSVKDSDETDLYLSTPRRSI